MAYLGIGYSGDEPNLLKNLVEQHKLWLSGDRQPKFFGTNFLVFYDSNTAREFVKKCIAATAPDTIVVFPMENSIDFHNY
ncbi:MAG: hypothetical protein JW795_04340 [Chitinivibrionales bacterium]|nr:hypothetical protein [Chitinivibrionales bacterium]